MRRWVLEILIVVVFVALGAVVARNAECQSCIATFCGSTAECNDGCVCAVQMGDATGHCVGTR